MSDPALLAHATRHTNIADYAAITPYLTPSAVSYLSSYIRDAYRNPRTRLQVSGLALVAYGSAGTTTKSQKSLAVVPKFDVPFKATALDVTVKPRVGLDDDRRMLVYGTARAVVPAHRGRVPYLNTLSQRFTYTIVGTNSAASSVAVDAWFGRASATTARKT